MPGLMVVVVISGGAIALITAGHSALANALLALLLGAVALLTLVAILRGRKRGLPVRRPLALLATWLALTVGGITAFGSGVLWLGIVLSGAAGYLVSRLATDLQAAHTKVAAAE